jgi:hypothetical protein
MKKTIAAFCVWLPAMLYAQQTRIIVDMETMKMKSPDQCLNMDSTTVLELHNVNPLTMSVTITSKNVRVFTEPPSALKSVVGWPEDGAGKDLGKQLDKLPEGRSSKELEEKQVELAKQREQIQSRLDSTLKVNQALQAELNKLNRSNSSQITEALNKFNVPDSMAGRALNLDERRLYLQQKLESETKAANERFALFEVEIAKLQAELKYLAEETKELKDEPYMEYWSQLVAGAKNVHAAWADLELLGARFKVLEALMKEPCLNASAMRARVGACGVEFMDECFNGHDQKLDQALSQFFLLYEAFLLEPAVNKRLASDQVLKAQVTGLRAAVNAVRTEYDKNDYGKIIANYHVLYTAMRSESTYIIRSLPVQAEQDYVEFEVQVEAKQGITGNCTVRTGTFIFKQYICRGYKLDFGTGPVALFGSQNESYRVEADPNDPTKVLLRQNEGREDLVPALAASAHISCRTNKSWKPQLMMGAALDMTEFKDVTMFLGGGFMVGRSPWISFQAGPVLRPVDVLKGNLEQDRAYAEDSIDPADLTEKKYKLGWFFGVSFLWNKEERETKKNK